MPDIIHIDMDCFFAAVEVKDNPALAGKPVIVGALPGSRGVVSAASYEARIFGVHSALPVSQAYKRCPHGVFIRPSGTRYTEESAAIMAIFREYTPLVEPLSLDEAFLDVAGSHRLFGSTEHIGREIKRRIREETGLVASVGVAPSKFIAKIASDLDKPDGFVLVADGEEREFLRPLGIRKMWGVGPKTAESLERYGMHTIGDIADFPLAEMVRLFGVHGRHLHQLANGIDKRAVVPSHERKQVSNEYTFSVDTGDMDEVERILLRLAGKVAERMLKKRVTGRTLTLKVRDETFRTRTRARALSYSIKNARDIYEQARELLRAEDLGGLKVRLIGVGVSSLDSSAQLSLFDAGSAADNRVDELMADIRGRFGSEAITRARLIGQTKKRSRPEQERM